MTLGGLLLEARNIGRKAAETGAWLIRDVTLSIAAGERVGLVGPSGSGKSVLLRSLAMLDALDAGKLLWCGQRVAREATPRYRSRVIYLHQRPALLEGTVSDNLLYPFQFSVHSGRQFERELVDQYLTLLGRDLSFLDKKSRDLSGGEQQLTALLRAIQLEPDMLLMDEPTAALDRATTEAVELCVAQWQNERSTDRSLVVVSHNMEQVERMVDRTVFIRHGKLASGPTSGLEERNR